MNLYVKQIKTSPLQRKIWVLYVSNIYLIVILNCEKWSVDVILILEFNSIQESSLLKVICVDFLWETHRIYLPRIFKRWWRSCWVSRRRWFWRNRGQRNEREWPGIQTEWETWLGDLRKCLTVVKTGVALYAFRLEKRYSGGIFNIRTLPSFTYFSSGLLRLLKGHFKKAYCQQSAQKTTKPPLFLYC